MAAVLPLIEEPRYKDFVDRYAFDPLRFAMEVVGMDATYQQADLFNSIAKPGARTSVASGHGSGKTSAAAVIGLWHLTCYYNSNTFFSAPKVETLRQGIWKEFTDHKQSIMSGPHAWIADYIIIEAEKVFIAENKMTWFCAVRTAPRGSPESLAGTHRTWLLWFIDEASGVPDENFGVIGGSLTDARNRMAIVSQPTRPAGFFYDTHHKMSRANGGVWDALTFNSEKSPLVSEAWLAEKLSEYGGREDPQYQIKVLGRFPDNLDTNLLGRFAAEACIGRKVFSDGEPYGLLLSCDVGAGEYRDKSVAVVAKVYGDGDFGPDARRVEVTAVPLNSNTRNLQDFTGAVFREAAELENVTTLVDAGGMGIAVCQGLETLGLPEVKRIKWGLPCFRKRNKDRFFNLRAQAMVHASRAAKDGRLGIADGPWRRELLDQMSRVPFHFDEKARYRILGKEQMRQQGLPSPDLWDAICFLFEESASYMICEGRDSRNDAVKTAIENAEALFSDI